ncbi:hypothetical protein HPB49_020650 [Dermacentor silvarum]|uniref:Uncharacterized protein n=1 Tax=Dermacentor silvarum TaxID=543639 RepID=A0ACB8E2K2_DERSI|nr:hypothetical protein HPB49_020650 [Dermacentor silvarum]
MTRPPGCSMAKEAAVRATRATTRLRNGRPDATAAGGPGEGVALEEVRPPAQPLAAHGAGSCEGVVYKAVPRVVAVVLPVWHTMRTTECKAFHAFNEHDDVHRASQTITDGMPASAIDDGGQSGAPKKYYRAPLHRIFVNRSLHLDKIKFFGFDMDYTIAQYKSPDYEAFQFSLLVDQLLSIGYPTELKQFQYDSTFPIRGLWFDSQYGNLLKVDPYGNILVCCHGFQFLKTIFNCMPCFFCMLTIVYSQHGHGNIKTYLLACLVDFFSTSQQYIPTKTGVKIGSLFMSYKSIFQDVRGAVDNIHTYGQLKTETINNLDKYLEKDERLPLLLDRMRAHDKKLFLLTNSDYGYTAKVMQYLFDFPSTKNRTWESYFDYIVVDARKPLFFGEGTILRQVDTGLFALVAILGHCNLARSTLEETSHELDMCYGILGSMFRSGSRQTFFANQICRYADIYAFTFVNLMYYPFSYMFRAPPMLMPHESTVNHEQDPAHQMNGDSAMDGEMYGKPSPADQPVRKFSKSEQVPLRFPEAPSQITHHHDTDDDDEDAERVTESQRQ